MKKLISMLTILATLSACAGQKFMINPNASGVKKTGSFDMSHFAISGIAQDDEIDAVEICGKKENIVSVEAKLTGLNVVFAMLTGGLYTPRTYKVYCKRD